MIRIGAAARDSNSFGLSTHRRLTCGMLGEFPLSVGSRVWEDAVRLNFIPRFDSRITHCLGAQGVMRQTQEPALFDHSSWMV